jgi:hypothetical protein
LSAKWLPTFADRGCHVVSVTDPYGRILGFLDRSRYFSIKQLLSCTHEAEWTPITSSTQGFSWANWGWQKTESVDYISVIGSAEEGEISYREDRRSNSSCSDDMLLLNTQQYIAGNKGLKWRWREEKSTYSTSSEWLGPKAFFLKQDRHGTNRNVGWILSRFAVWDRPTSICGIQSCSPLQLSTRLRCLSVNKKSTEIICCFKISLTFQTSHLMSVTSCALCRIWGVDTGVYEYNLNIISISTSMDKR